jgi:Tfp pilus assembly protein PilN
MIEINLLPEGSKLKPKSKSTKLNLNASYFLYFMPVLFGILICVNIYLIITVIAKNNQYRILDAKWKKLEPQKKMLESYNQENAILSENVESIQKFAEQRINWAEKLNKLSLYLPPGIWFRELFGSSNELILRASVIALERDEMDLIAKLIDNLKNDPGFLRGLNNLELGPVQHRSQGSYDIADFTLTATFKSK